MAENLRRVTQDKQSFDLRTAAELDDLYRTKINLEERLVELIRYKTSFQSPQVFPYLFSVICDDLLLDLIDFLFFFSRSVYLLSRMYTCCRYTLKFLVDCVH